MDNTNKFEYPKLPSQARFCSILRFSGIGDDNYRHALNVYDKFKCSKFLD